MTIISIEVDIVRTRSSKVAFEVLSIDSVNVYCAVPFIESQLKVVRKITNQMLNKPGKYKP